MGDQAHRPARLILVKHGMPQIEPDRPRSTWGLSAAGRPVAERLGAKLAGFNPSRLFSSIEPKAVETAHAIGSTLKLDAETDPDFGEHRADDGPFISAAAFEAEVAALFRDPKSLVMGEETGEAATRRFDAAVSRLAGADSAVVVAHGRVVSLWLAHRLGVDPMPFWKSFAFCHAAVVQDGRVDLVAP